MDDISLAPVNLAALGLRTAVRGRPDLITIWKTPYPVLNNYQEFCRVLGLRPFAGGSIKKQGSRTEPGYITSGYRFSSARRNSPHRFALAVDVSIGDVEAQIVAAGIGLKYFTRIGLYPDNGFIHLDLANEIWMKKYGGRRFWVLKNGIYTGFDDFRAMIKFAESSV